MVWNCSNPVSRWRPDAGAWELPAEVHPAELGGRSRNLRLDVSSADDWQRVVAETERDLGPVSVLVNNAGIIEWGTMERREQRRELCRTAADAVRQSSRCGTSGPIRI
ncbi:SDR family NAD(P)-dependent oxidoreductase [Streptomyces sp. TRM68367]|uniref:SDR family NAD(P)-dependent oxidoreductase n=1 Tax=Streptomyces sp. TRM68367 TaxID=2758415 RepID=UPI00165CD605|nr:SDR family NAD(P)-dependent oxidoreductase [Streptomyces sp. TRM68367]MBC9728195.1 SDR family NAD(P)-dependent oxidoreductase [Streptomyces sp. TRM68367]